MAGRATVDWTLCSLFRPASGASMCACLVVTGAAEGGPLLLDARRDSCRAPSRGVHRRLPDAGAWGADELLAARNAPRCRGRALGLGPGAGRLEWFSVVSMVCSPGFRFARVQPTLVSSLLPGVPACLVGGGALRALGCLCA